MTGWIPQWGICAHCKARIFRAASNGAWVHYGSWNTHCFATTVATPMQDVDYCPSCEHPWFYHREAGGCTMSLLNATDLPVGRLGARVPTCECRRANSTKEPS